MNHTISKSWRARLGFSLVELIAVMTVVGTIAGVAAPLMVGASDNFAIATRQRAAADRLDYALVRASRLLRAAPGAIGGGANIATAGESRIVFADGARLELLGSTLWIAPAGEAAAPLCQSVSVFQLTYLGADGETDTRADPGATRRIRMRLRSDDVEARTTVFLVQTELSDEGM